MADRMGVLSLKEMATKVAIRNIDLLEDVGSFEYWMIQPVLKHIRSAEQLHEIEINCPHIAGECADIWQVMVERDYPAQWKRDPRPPKDPKKWYDLYCKLKREDAEEFARGAEALKDTMSGLNKEKNSNTTLLVDSRSLPKLPRDPRMRKNNGGVPITRSSGVHKKSANNSVLTWGIGSRTKTTDGKSVLLRARREAKEMSTRNRLGVPSNRLGGSMVQQAPPSMIEAHKRAAVAPLRIHAPKRTAPPSPVIPVRDSVREAGERRRRALSMGSGTYEIIPRRATSDNESSYDERERERELDRTSRVRLVQAEALAFSDDEEEDDLFGEKVTPQKKTTNGSFRRPALMQSPASRISQKAKPSDVISSLISSGRKPSSGPAGGRMVSGSPPQGRAATGASRNSTARPGTPQSRSGDATRLPAIKKREPVDPCFRPVKKQRRT